MFLKALVRDKLAISSLTCYRNIIERVPIRSYWKKKTALVAVTDRDKCVFIRLRAKPSIEGYNLATHHERRTVLGADNYSNKLHYSVMSLCPQLPGCRPLVFAKVLLKAEHVLKSLLGKQHFNRAEGSREFEVCFTPCFSSSFFFSSADACLCVCVRVCRACLLMSVTMYLCVRVWVCGERNTGWCWGVEEKPTEASVLN